MTSYTGEDENWTEWYTTSPFNLYFEFFENNEVRTLTIQYIYQRGAYFYDEENAALTISIPEADNPNYTIHVISITVNEFILQNSLQAAYRYQGRHIRIE